ncbi:MAG: glycosyltransferase [Halobacteriota archaeon]
MRNCFICNRLHHVKKEAQRRIILPGYASYDDLPPIYSAATASIFPLLYEWFGLPPLEAKARDCPVVLSNNGSLTEVTGGSGALQRYSFELRGYLTKCSRYCA